MPFSPRISCDLGFGEQKAGCAFTVRSAEVSDRRILTAIAPERSVRYSLAVRPTKRRNKPYSGAVCRGEIRLAILRPLMKFRSCGRLLARSLAALATATQASFPDWPGKEQERRGKVFESIHKRV